MASVSRRSLLKNMAKVSALGAMAPFISTLGCTGSEDRQITLNVVLHGLFVLNVLEDEKKIELLTPIIDEHLHKLGSWDDNAIYDIRRGTDTELQGAKHEDALPPLSASEAPYHVIYYQDKDKFTIHHERSFHRIVLPFPKDFRLLRTVGNPQHSGSARNKPKAAEGPDTHCCCNGEVQPIIALSLCQALIYDVPNVTDLRMPGFDWNPVVHDPSNTSCDIFTQKGIFGDEARKGKDHGNEVKRFANLHLWAEPHKRLNPEHADRAYQTLSELVCPLRLRLAVYSTTPIDCSENVPGLPPEQEQGWSEWASGGGEGSYPTNCCAVMTRKTSPTSS